MGDKASDDDAPDPDRVADEIRAMRRLVFDLWDGLVGHGVSKDRFEAIVMRRSERELAQGRPANAACLEGLCEQLQWQPHERTPKPEEADRPTGKE